MRADGASAPALDTWWEGFGDPELTRILQRALDQNLDLAASLTRVEQARATAKEAGAPGWELLEYVCVENNKDLIRLNTTEPK